MRFTASYDQHMGGKILGESDDLQTLLTRLKGQNVNDYHCEITEWDMDEVDGYGCPDHVVTVRIFLIKEEDVDLLNYVNY